MAYNPRKRKVKKNIPVGQAHIHSTYNNTVVSITDTKGNVISWASAGSIGYKGSRKKTPYAAGLAADQAAEGAKEAGVKKIEVFMKGVGSGRENAMRALQGHFEVTAIKDGTPVPHNGCSPSKRRSN